MHSAAHIHPNLFKNYSSLFFLQTGHSRNKYPTVSTSRYFVSFIHSPISITLTWRRVKPRLQQGLRGRGPQVIHAKVPTIVPCYRKRARTRGGLSQQADAHHHAYRVGSRPAVRSDSRRSAGEGGGSRAEQSKILEKGRTRIRQKLACGMESARRFIVFWYGRM